MQSEPGWKWSALLVVALASGCGGESPEVKLDTSSPPVPVVAESPKPAIAEVEVQPTQAELAEPVQLSAAAASHVRELMAKDRAKDKLRISLVEKFGGDVHWNANLISNVDALDDTTYTSQGITIVIDRATQKLIVGTKVDCIERNGTKAFVFENAKLKTLR